MSDVINAPAPAAPEALEDRVARLEARLSTEQQWRPDPGDIAQEGLHDPFRLPDGSLEAPEGPVGDPLTDLASGALHPTTWAQMATCLRIMALQVDWLSRQLGG